MPKSCLISKPIDSNVLSCKELCIGIVKKDGEPKRQCTRKKKFGDLCGLHYNKQKRYGVIEKVCIEKCDKRQVFVKKQNQSELINHIDCFNNDLNNNSNNKLVTMYQGITELVLDIQTNIVYKELFNNYIKYGKFDVINNRIVY